MLIRHLFFFFFIISLHSLHAGHISIITMPKSGTHLLLKALDMLHRNCEPPLEYKRHVSHFGTSPLDEYPPVPIELLESRKFIFLMRSPKDMIVSWVFHYDSMLKGVMIGKYPGWFYTTDGQQWFEVWKDIHTFDEKISTILEDKVHMTQYSCILKHGLTYIETGKGLTIRFEDLIGEKGGGSKESQLDVLRQIVDYCDIPISEEKIEFVAHSLWGKKHSTTDEDHQNDRYFRSGKIGDSARYFSIEHEALYEERFGALARRLGYE